MKKEYTPPSSEQIYVQFEGCICESNVNPGSGVESMNEPSKYGW